MKVIIILFFFIFFQTLNEAQDLRRNPYTCFKKEFFKKIKGKWVVDSYESWKYDDYESTRYFTQFIPKVFINNKLDITEEEIKWAKPIYDTKTQKVITHKCKISEMVVKLQKNFVDALNFNIPKEEYFKEKTENPFGWHIFIETSVDGSHKRDNLACEGSYNTEKIFNNYSLEKLILDVEKEILKINNTQFHGTIHLKKETPMEKIDFSKLENCNHEYDSWWNYQYELEDNSILESLEGEWKVFKTYTNNYNAPWKNEEKEKAELIGTKVSVTKDGFYILPKNDTYSRYYMEKSCSNKRALILKSKLKDVINFGRINNFDYLTTAGTIGTIFIKTKKGIKEVNAKDSDIVLAIDNPCQMTIFDFILIFKNKTMVLQMGGELLYLKRVKKNNS
jgi:hypothetical protein